MFLLLQLHKEQQNCHIGRLKSGICFSSREQYCHAKSEGHAIFVWTYLHLVLFSRTKLESCVYFIKKRKDTKERQGPPPSTRERNSLYLH